MDHNCAFVKKQALYVRLMQRHDIHVTILAPSVWMNPYGRGTVTTEKHPEFEGELCTVPVLFKTNVPRHLYRASLSKLLAVAKPDVIYGYHDYYMLAAYQLFRAARSCPKVPIGFYASQNINKTFPFPLSAMESAVLSRADYLFPICDGATEVARAKGFTGQIVEMPLFVDTTIFKPTPNAAQSLRAKLGLDGNAFLVGFAGRFIPAKGLDLLIDAVRQANDPNIHLVFIGQGPEEPTLQARASELGIGAQLHFLPSASQIELAPLMSACDAVALPSLTTPQWKEQFGRLIIEALACGTPVIGSDSGAIPEVISATKGGIVVPEGDAAALSSAMVKLKSSPELLKKLATDGQAEAVSSFSLDAMVDRMAKHFFSARAKTS